MQTSFPSLIVGLDILHAVSVRQVSSCDYFPGPARAQRIQTPPAQSQRSLGVCDRGRLPLAKSIQVIGAPTNLAIA